MWEKIPGHERNEALDCRNYANAAFKASGADLDAVAQRLAELAGGGKKTAAKKQTQQPVRKRQSGGLDRYFEDW